jgi:hypothetical protein
MIAVIVHAVIYPRVNHLSETIDRNKSVIENLSESKYPVIDQLIVFYGIYAAQDAIEHNRPGGDSGRDLFSFIRARVKISLLYLFSMLIVSLATFIILKRRPKNA